MTTNYQQDLQRRLQDPEFKKEYDALESEFAIIQAVIDARKAKKLTQKEQSHFAHASKTGLRHGHGTASLFCPKIEVKSPAYAGFWFPHRFSLRCDTILLVKNF
jgi:hypothetical protein